MTAFFSALTQRYVRPFTRRLHLEEGLEAVEYALIAALLSVVIIAGVQLLGTGAGGTGAIDNLFQGIANVLNGADPDAPAG